MFKYMAGNIPDGNFLDKSFPGGNSPWRNLMDGNFPGGSFPGEFSSNLSDLSDEILTNHIS